MDLQLVLLPRKIEIFFHVPIFLISTTGQRKIGALPKKFRLFANTLNFFRLFAKNAEFFQIVLVTEFLIRIHSAVCSI